MNLVLTGGGTGGHVYPALEIGRIAQEQADLLYLGSIRGMESAACESRGIPFQGFESEPLYRVTSLQGLRSIARMFQASFPAAKTLSRFQPDLVFSTGGYSSAPVMLAAKRLGIPMGMHICDAVPGRVLRMFAPFAKVITCTFESTTDHLPKKVNRDVVIRTGHPIRDELRRNIKLNRASSGSHPLVLVTGGSGGAQFLNDAIPALASELSNVNWIHSTGKNQFEKYKDSTKNYPNYKIVPYLESEEMTRALGMASCVISRSGSGISEFALARLPSILVPLPSSADDHQRHNAQEFVKMGAASLLLQPGFSGALTRDMEANPENFAREITKWLERTELVQAAEHALEAWDRPNATQEIFIHILNAAGRSSSSDGGSQ